MNKEIVKLKGDTNGFRLEFLVPIDFPLLLTTLEEKLKDGKNFFKRGMTFKLDENLFSEEEILKLTELFTEYGIILRPITSPSDLEKSKEDKTAADISRQATLADVTVIDHTVRGGQEIVAKGSVIICGNVNPGAHIVAGGNIDIRGTCRGTVHAGAYGNKNVFIIADQLMPVQIRIADEIAQAPEKNEKPSFAEKAFIKNGCIVIEPIER